MYYDILRIVEEVTGVTAKEMLTSNAEENVDARHILVYVLGNRGFSDNVKCNGNVFAYNLLTPVTIAFAATPSEAAVAKTNK